MPTCGFIILVWVAACSYGEPRKYAVRFQSPVPHLRHGANHTLLLLLLLLLLSLLLRLHYFCLGRCLFLRGTSKIRIAVTKEFIKKYTKTRSNYHAVLKLNYFKCRKTNEFNYSAGWFNYSAGWRSFQINHPSKEQNWRNLWGARGLTTSKEGS